MTNNEDYDDMNLVNEISKKKLLKMIYQSNNPIFLEILVVAAETRRRQLNPGFESESPRG